MKYNQTILKISVHPEGENPVFGERSTHVFIEDEAGGPYIKIQQCNDNSENSIISVNDIEELNAIVDAAKELLKQFDDPCYNINLKE